MPQLQAALPLPFGGKTFEHVESIVDAKATMRDEHCCYAKVVPPAFRLPLHSALLHCTTGPPSATLTAAVQHMCRGEMPL